jgi:hypothetical protein
MKVYLLLPLFFILFSCEENEDLTEDQLKQKMETISKSIEDLVSISCNSADQCKAAPIGAKPCGGPTHYIIYSSGTYEEQLSILIDEYTEANKKYNELSGIGSDCAVENPPTLDCVSGKCEVVSE